jgi:hypothetical protein
MIRGQIDDFKLIAKYKPLNQEQRNEFLDLLKKEEQLRNFVEGETPVAKKERTPPAVVKPEVKPEIKESKRPELMPVPAVAEVREKSPEIQTEKEKRGDTVHIVTKSGNRLTNKSVSEVTLKKQEGTDKYFIGEEEVSKNVIKALVKEREYYEGLSTADRKRFTRGLTDDINGIRVTKEVFDVYQKSKR